MIYDEESDQLKHIAFRQAVLACGLPLEGAGSTATDAGSFLNAIKWGQQDLTTVTGDAGAGENPINPTTTALQLITEIENGWWAPLCITIVRPFIEHLMMSCVACVSGRDTGATLFGPAGKVSRSHSFAPPLAQAHAHQSCPPSAPADMQISANTSVKTIEGHYVSPLPFTRSPLGPFAVSVAHVSTCSFPRLATPSR